jgi:hypothetical protein
MVADAFHVEAGKLIRHVELITSLTTEIEQHATPLTTLTSTVTPAWTGTTGGAKMLRDALAETVSALGRTGAEARTNAGHAGTCAAGYTGQDEKSAAAFRACLAPAGR